MNKILLQEALVSFNQNNKSNESRLIEDEEQNQKSTHICRVFRNIRNNDKLYLNDSNALLFYFFRKYIVKTIE